MSIEFRPIHRTILSLCDYSGVWSEPYKQAGYNVIQVDLKHGQDLRFLHCPGKVHGILASPPCTHFAILGARHWKNKTEAQLAEGLALVDACLRFVVTCKPAWWVLENPVGRLKNWLGEPVARFQPYEYGDPWTKKTCLWGKFTMPKPTDIVKPEYYGPKGKTVHIKGSGENRRAARSETPKGFARAFFKANP